VTLVSKALSDPHAFNNKGKPVFPFLSFFFLTKLGPGLGLGKTVAKVSSSALHGVLS
jgi:hypothetical protein